MYKGVEGYQVRIRNREPGTERYTRMQDGNRTRRPEEDIPAVMNGRSRPRRVPDE